MPLNLVCSFCGRPIEPGTGVMYVRNDNQRLYFCTKKCERNMLGLGRKARKLKWTEGYERGTAPAAKGQVEAEGEAGEAGENSS